jgi:hypothetical protein
LPSNLGYYIKYKYISDDSKLYFLTKNIKDPEDKQLYFYRCDPFSNDLRVDEIAVKYNPGKPPSMVTPCDVIEESNAPYHLKLIKYKRTNKEQRYFGNSYKLVYSNIIYQITIDDNYKLSGIDILDIDKNGNTFWQLWKENYTSDPPISQYNLAILNNKGEFIR